MLIICPDCESSYEVDAADIGPSGRKVRCTECGSVWHARPAESSAPAVEGDAVWPHAPEPLARAAEEIRNVPVEPVPEDGFEDRGPAAPSPIEDIVSHPALQDAKEASRRSRSKPRGTAPRSPLSRRGLTFAAAACVATLTLLTAGRATVVALVPDLAGLYEAVGLPVNLRGLEFEGISTQERVEQGVPQLAVRGTILNVTDEAVSVPRLRLAVRNKSGREIFVWTAMPARAELGPGEKLPFFAQIASPPAEGREVSVRFVGSRDGVQTAAR